MEILGLLGMYFDAVVLEVKTLLLLFRLARAILCCYTSFSCQCDRTILVDILLVVSNELLKSRIGYI